MEEENVILVVDDIPDNVELLTQILEQHNYSVLKSYDGEDAIFKTTNFKPDLILLDVMMPSLDGFSVCKELKKSAFTKYIPIILITAREDRSDVIKGFKAGASDYIIKPINSDELLARVENQIQIKNLRDKLEERNKQLMDYDRQKNEFLEVVSHDLKSPISSILGFSENILDDLYGDLNEDMKTVIERVKKNAELTLTFLEDLYNITKAESGELLLNLKLTSAYELINTAVNINSSLAERKGIELAAKVPDNMPDFQCDFEKILAVLNNLISNAIKFSFENDTITVSAEKDTTYIKFEVADTGQGIPEKDFNKLFEKFQKISTVPTGGEKGTGLGLAIAKNFIELHEGEIWAQSKRGKGSKFFFTIPLKIGEGKAIRTRKILLLCSGKECEDYVEIIKKVPGHNLEIKVAREQTESFEILKNDRFSIIIIDKKETEKVDEQFFNSLKERTGSARIVYMFNEKSKDAARKALEIGAHGILKKPLQLKVVKPVFDRMLRSLDTRRKSTAHRILSERKLLGELILEKGLATPLQVLRCLNIQTKEELISKKRRMLGEILLEENILRRDDLKKILEDEE